MDKPKPWFRYSLASMLLAIALMAAFFASFLPSWRGAVPKFPPCGAGAQAGATVSCNSCHNSTTVQSGLAYLNEQPARRKPIPDLSNPAGHPGPMQLVAGQANQCTQCHAAVRAQPAATKPQQLFPFVPAPPAHTTAHSAPAEIP
ncbi:MAG TPA: hypothetical protein VGY53_09410 [Isosphaeraceae bacterium]|jgi:hypothetical protein|nr:hypothetical protein [Isosphaeraceae bacterium]